MIPQPITEQTELNDVFLAIGRTEIPKSHLTSSRVLLIFDQFESLPASNTSEFWNVLWNASTNLEDMPIVIAGKQKEKKEWWERIEPRHAFVLTISGMLGLVGVVDLGLLFFGRSVLNWYNDVVLLLGAFEITITAVMMLSRKNNND